MEETLQGGEKDVPLGTVVGEQGMRGLWEATVSRGWGCPAKHECLVKPAFHTCKD